MISRMFKRTKRLDSARAEDRRTAIEALDAEDATARQEELARLARDDPDRAVRAAALAQLSSDRWLEPLVSEGLPGAAQRAAQLVLDGRLDALARHPRVVAELLALDPSEKRLRELLAEDDRTLLLEVVLSAPQGPRERLLEHPAFFCAQPLGELEHRSRGHDKRLNRLARQRLEELRAHRARAEELNARIEERLSGLERSSSAAPADRAALQRRAALLEAVEHDLAALTELAPALEVAGEAPSGLRELTSRHGALVSETPAPAEPVVAETDRTFEALQADFEALDSALARDTDFDALAARRQALTTEWLAAADHAPPSASEHATFERVSHRFRELAEAHERLAALNLPSLETTQLPVEVSTSEPPSDAVWEAAERLRRNLERARSRIDALRWPEWAPSPPPLATHLEQVAAAAERMTAWQTGLSRLDEWATAELATLESHIDAGEVQDAKATLAGLREISRALRQHGGTEISKRLGQAQARLAELSDWQTFATSPKREELCRAMTELATEPLPGPDQAERIKQLRDEWNGLGPIASGADHRLLDQFNEAAERAFEPCRSYFSEQAERRASNLEARKQICDSLAQYLASTDWQHADFKAAEQIMRTARREWREFHPVDRNPGRPLAQRFESLQAELHERIKTEWDRNLARKRGIVDAARELAETDLAVDEKVNQAKSLQREWKAVGVTPRRPDQTLWREFRQHCDRIFQARDDARSSAEQSIQDAQAAAEQLLADVRTALDDAAVEGATLRDWQNRFQALPVLPERLRRPLEREFENLVRSARLLLREQASAVERARLTTLAEQDAAVAALEADRRRGEEVDWSPPDPLFAARWETVTDEVPVEALRALAVQAEIAADLDSAPADRELRMSIQIELMNSGRGQADLNPAELLERWCAAGPKDDAVVEPLRERFFAALTRLS